jgi:hypothetical protein
VCWNSNKKFNQNTQMKYLNIKTPTTTQCFAIGAALLCTTSTSYATTLPFLGGNNTDSDWNVGTNWTGDSVPGSGDTALVNQNRRAYVDSDVAFGGILTNQNTSNDAQTSEVDVRTGGILAVSTASNGSSVGGHGLIKVTGGTMTTTGAVTNRDVISLESGNLSLFNSATSGNNQALSAATGSLNVTGGALTAGAAMTSGTIQFYSAIDISAGSFTTVAQTFFSGTSLTINGDAATIGFKDLNQLGSRAVDFNFNFGTTDVSTIVSTGFMNLAGATINVDGSGYSGGANVFTLLASTNYGDDVFAGQLVTGFTGLDGIVSASGNDLILTLTTAVPEPGTYALLAGITGLVFVMVGRRR